MHKLKYHMTLLTNRWTGSCKLNLLLHYKKKTFVQRFYDYSGVKIEIRVGESFSKSLFV